MQLRDFGLAGLLIAALTLPAAAQTTQTTPQKPTTSIPAAKPAASTAAAKPAALIDINTAPAADLDALPGIGETRAAAIIAGRPYKGKDELLTKHILPKHIYNGIKNKVIAKQG